MNRFLSTSLAGVVTYVCVAACSGASGSNSGQVGEGGLGSVGNPVPPAGAATGGSSSTGGSAAETGGATAVSCDCPEAPVPVSITKTCPGSTESTSVRPFDFPGFSEVELAQLVAITKGAGGPVGFSMTVTPWVAEEKAAVLCTGGNDVVFIVPGHLASKLD